MQVRGGCGATAVGSLTVRFSHSALRQSTLRALSSFGARCILAETPTHPLERDGIEHAIVQGDIVALIALKGLLKD